MDKEDEARQMRDEDYVRLLEDTQREFLAGAGPAALLGLTEVTLRLLASLVSTGLDILIVSSPTWPPSGAILTGEIPKWSPGTSRTLGDGWKRKIWC